MIYMHHHGLDVKGGSKKKEKLHSTKNFDLSLPRPDKPTIISPIEGTDQLV